MPLATFDLLLRPCAVLMVAIRPAVGNVPALLVELVEILDEGFARRLVRRLRDVDDTAGAEPASSSRATDKLVMRTI